MNVISSYLMMVLWDIWLTHHQWIVKDLLNL
jgi:hypothetical protein